jgi:GcrA cell cycle regulator
MYNGSPWTDEAITKLKLLWNDGCSTAEIGRRLNVSKNAVVGKAHRLDLPARNSPIKRRDVRPAQQLGPAESPRAAATLPPVQPIERRLARIAAPGYHPAAMPACTITKPAAAVAPLPWEPRAPHRCCWPFGNPGAPGFRFCNAPALRAKPYCTEHDRRAYIK